MARNSSNHLLRDSWTETRYVRFGQGEEATVTRVGLKKMLRAPKVYTRQHYSYTLEAPAYVADGVAADLFGANGGDGSSFTQPRLVVGFPSAWCWDICRKEVSHSGAVQQ